MPTPEVPDGAPPPMPPTNPSAPSPSPPTASPATTASRPTKPRWPWVVGGIGCLSVIAICVVAAIFFTKASGIVNEARTRADRMAATKNKLVGAWKKEKDDPTVQTFNNDGTLVVQIFGTNLGKKIELALSGTYRLDGDELSETYTDVRLVTKIENQQFVEPLMKKKMAEQLKFGETQHAKLTWGDANTFTISEDGQAPQVWKRQ